MDDRQIILLCSYLPEYAETGEIGDQFFGIHEEILDPPEQILGSMTNSQGKELNSSMKFHLASLGLLERKSQIGSIGINYESQTYSLTPIGERFLRFLELGQAEE